MIESIIYAGAGFLVGGLLFIGFIPVAHERAVRLTQRRLDAMTPISMTVINAGRNRLRAEFARSTRRLEVSVRRLSAEVTRQLATLAKKGDAIVRLRLELGRTSAAALAAEARRKAAADQLGGARRELAAGTESLQAAECIAADASAFLAKVAADLRESATMASCRRIELSVQRSRHEVLKGHVARHEQKIGDLQRRIDAETAMSAAADRQLTEERSKAEALAARLGELKRHLVVKSIETEVLARRAQELERRLEERTSPMARREPASATPEPVTVRRAGILETSGRVAPNAAALVSRERSLLLVTFRKAAGVWSRIGRSRGRDLPERRLAASG
jgi:hypothetical protein